MKKKKLSQKDKSLLLFIASLVVILWGIYSLFSYFFFSAAFHVSDAKKIVASENTKWLNTSRALETADLKDRVILLHFWTYDCVNCLEALPQLKDLEEQFGSNLTVIGVHSGKFDSQKDFASIRKAVLRYDISHPVIDDSDRKIADAFEVKSWPTFILLNPHGHVEKILVGESQAEKLKRSIKKLIKKFKFQISRNPLPLVLEKSFEAEHVLSFPSKITYVANFSYKSRSAPALIISNAGANNIIVANLSGDIIAKIGSGRVGFENGSFDVASFNSPQGLLYSDEKLYVADSNNHAIRLVDFKEGKVSTLLGTGERGEALEEDFPDAKKAKLSSPTDIEFFPNKDTLAIANAGSNQILTYSLNKQSLSVLAGSGEEGIEDGKYPQNSLAQTSDLAAYGHKLYFIDSQSSALRVIDESGNVKTLIGQGVEKFGYKNGGQKEALMQHPLGLTVDDTGAYITDSLNNVVRKFDFSSNQIRTLAGSGKKGDGLGKAVSTQFEEPSGIVAVLDRFYVADSLNNRILVLSRGSLNSDLLNVMPPLKLPKQGFLEYLPNLHKAADAKVKSDVELVLKISLAQGWKLNKDGPSFVNLLEFVDGETINLAASFDWESVMTKSIKLPKLSEGKDYVLQGVIYYCEDKANSLCYIKSYEQKLTADSDEKSAHIEVKVGEK